MSFDKRLAGDELSWQCGACGKWNSIEEVECSKCKTTMQSGAVAFRKHNKLTTQEKNFYQVSVPTMVNELTQIRALLSRLVKKIEETPDE